MPSNCGDWDFGAHKDMNARSHKHAHKQVHVFIVTVVLLLRTVLLTQARLNPKDLKYLLLFVEYE